MDNYLIEKAKKITEQEFSEDEPLHTPNEKGATQQKKFPEPVLLDTLSIDANPIDWIWEGYLAKGHITLLSSLPKVGKSTLISWLLFHLQNKDTFVGQIVMPCKVLILTEESHTHWARRREKFIIGITGTEWVCRPMPTKPSESEWKQFVETNVQFCLNNNIELVIVDTISAFWPVRDENAAPQVYAALLPFYSFSTKGISVLLIHHDRKSQGEEGTASRGSSAIPGFVDIIVELRRFDTLHPTDTRRILRTLSRFEESIPELVIELTPQGYQANGTKAQVIQEEKFDVLLRLLPHEPSGKTVEMVREEWPSDEQGKAPHKATLLRWLEKLVKEGRVREVGKVQGKGQATLWARSVALQLQPYTDATED